MDLIRILVLVPLMALVQQTPSQPPVPDANAPQGSVEKTDAPKKPALTVAPDAQQVLDDMGKAYRDLKYLQLAGTLRVDIKIDGEKPEQHDVKFSANFESPNKFRQEVPNEVLLGSTGTNVYSFKAKDKNYTLASAPKDRAALSEYPEQIAQSLTSQNISLALALCSDPAQELVSDATGVSKVADTQIDGVGYPTLKIGQDDQTATLVSVDPSTHLVKQVQNDLTLVLKKRRPDLKSAIVSTLYTDVKTNAPDNAVTYAWTPPAGAVDAAAAAMARANQDTPDGSQLLGKAAPGFKLNGLDGKEVSLASLKGKVVILDFWATWCGPCRMGLPKIDGIATAHKDDAGLKVYAMNLREDADTVKQFVKSTKLGLPVLMDSDGKTADAYGVQAIPFTVIVGPDGKVVKVFVGYDPNEANEIEKIIKPLLAKAG